MRPHIFPKHRHIVVIGAQRFPTKVMHETFATYITAVGTFSKALRTKLGNSTIRFDGPFGSDGIREPEL